MCNRAVYRWYLSAVATIGAVCNECSAYPAFHQRAPIDGMPEPPTFVAMAVKLKAFTGRGRRVQVPVVLGWYFLFSVKHIVFHRFIVLIGRVEKKISALELTEFFTDHSIKMTTIVSNALKTAAIGGLIGFGVGMVSGMVKKKPPGEEVAISKDPEIEQMGHQLHDYGNSRPVIQSLYDLSQLEAAEPTMSLPQEAYAIKHQIDVELGAIFDNTAADRQGKLKELINEIVEYADGKVKNLVFEVQETITD